MIKNTLLILMMLPLLMVAQTDNESPCAHSEKSVQVLSKYPFLAKNIKDSEAQLELETNAYLANRGGDTEIYTIPVVFHIIHNGGSENISDEQVYSAIEGLNRDFRLLNEDFENVPDQFQDIAGDVEIEFKLAQIDPDEQCTKGIVRIQSPLTYDGYNDELKALSFWPRDMYLNIWVVAEIQGNVVGYTFLPSTVNSIWMQDQDGIVLKSDFCGIMGTSNNQRSRTLVHECGHWLNLLHTWGTGNGVGNEGNCGGDDFCNDTPNTIGTQGGCNMLLENCGSLDNINNYMDYTSCKFMFSEDQKARMRAAAESSVAQRSSLWQESNLLATGVFDSQEIVCQAVFYVDRSAVCNGDSIQFEDDSYHGITFWSWDFGDGTILEGSDPEIHQNPIHVYDEEGEYSVTLTVSDGIDEASDVQENFISVYAGDFLGNVLIESFENGVNEDKWDEFNLDNDNITWEETGVTSWDGEESLRLRNRFVTIYNATDELISAPFDFSNETSIIINYKWAFALKSDHSDDRFKVSTSNDCGMSWTLREVHRGQTDLPTAPDTDANFVPNDQSEWAEETIFIDNLDQLTDNFRIKFEFNGRGGNNFYLDAINIGNETTLGIEDFELNQFINVFPNPSSDGFQIVFEKSSTEKSIVQLFDITGRVVFIEEYNTVEENNFFIPRNEMASGMYILTIDQGGKNYRLQIVLE